MADDFTCILRDEFKRFIEELPYEELRQSIITEELEVADRLLALSERILTNQSIKIGRREWPTRDHCEKSQKQLSSLPVIAGWIFASEVSLKSKYFVRHINTTEHNIFHMNLKNLTSACDHLKTSNWSADNFKKYSTSMVDTWARGTVRWYRAADTLFWQLSIDHNINVQYVCNISSPGLPN